LAGRFITWIGAHSPQAKGRIERSFGTAQDRLVKELRVAGVNTLEQANEYLEQEFIPWWNETLTVAPASADDAHRPLEKQHDLMAILSHVEARQVHNDYTIHFEAKVYQIERKAVWCWAKTRSCGSCGATTRWQPDSAFSRSLPGCECVPAAAQAGANETS
jgi:hypothetical protein